VLSQASCQDAPNASSSSPVAASTKPQPRKMPLLQAELILTPDGSDFAYSIPVNIIRSRIIAVLDKGISKLQVLLKSVMCLWPCKVLPCVSRLS